MRSSAECYTLVSDSAICLGFFLFKAPHTAHIKQKCHRRRQCCRIELIYLKNFSELFYSVMKRSTFSTIEYHPCLKCVAHSKDFLFFPFVYCEVKMIPIIERVNKTLHFHMKHLSKSFLILHGSEILVPA